MPRFWLAQLVGTHPQMNSEWVRMSSCRRALRIMHQYRPTAEGGYVYTRIGLNSAISYAFAGLLQSIGTVTCGCEQAWDNRTSPRTMNKTDVDWASLLGAEKCACNDGNTEKALRAAVAWYTEMHLLSRVFAMFRPWFSH